MNRRALAIFALIVPFAVSAYSQVGAPTPFDRASRTFAAADRNLDGVLDSRELARASIPASAVKAWDHDQGGSLSKDEFLLYYRQLMVNAGQAPGVKLQEEARRIEARRRADQAREAKRVAREKELDELRLNKATTKTTRESTELRFEKAQAALKGGATQADRSADAAAANSTQELADRARKALGAGTGAADAGASAFTEERLARADTALEGQADEASDEGAEGQGTGAGGEVTPEQRDLDRALAALEKRAKDGGWTRERYEAVRKDLIKRANNERAGTAGKQAGDDGSGGQGVGAAGAVNPEQRGPEQANSERVEIAGEPAVEEGVAVQATGTGAEAMPEQRGPDRANAALVGVAGAQVGDDGSDDPGPGAGGEVSPEQRDLDRALAALDKRAKDGGWTRERYEEVRKGLIKRANNERAGTAGKRPGNDSSGGGEVSPEQRDLDRALAALEKRAKDGGWTRERYEQVRKDLIKRANNERAGTAGKNGGGNGVGTDPGSEAGVVPVSGTGAAGQDTAPGARKQNAVFGDGSKTKARRVQGRPAKGTKQPAELKAAGSDSKAPPKEAVSGQKTGNQGAQRQDARQQRTGEKGAAGTDAAKKESTQKTGQEGDARQLNGNKAKTGRQKTANSARGNAGARPPQEKSGARSGEQKKTGGPERSGG